MKILVAGASGLIGAALIARLRANRHNVVRLVRRAARASSEFAWDPAARTIAAAALEGVDAVVNLAGENISAGRWTAARRERLWRSRVDATRTLVDAMGRREQKPATLLSASAGGFYGDRGDERLTESSAMGAGFLAELCAAWEAEAQRAEGIDVRTVRLRFGLVLGGSGGVLGKMRPIFRLGLGGRMGSGQQWMSWVSLPDAVGAVEHALTAPELAGAVNIAAPGAVRNAEFAVRLGAALRRPAILPAPAPLLRLALGRMADEALLASVRLEPRRLLESGFGFRHPTLDAALRQVLAQHGSPDPCKLRPR